jgi:hypothetical protein
MVKELALHKLRYIVGSPFIADQVKYMTLLSSVGYCRDDYVTWE